MNIEVEQNQLRLTGGPFEGEHIGVVGRPHMLILAGHRPRLAGHDDRLHHYYALLPDGSGYFYVRTGIVQQPV